MVGLLGLLDLHAAVLLAAFAWQAEVPVSVIAVTAVLLFAKACISLMDIGGLQDIAAVILMLLSLFLPVPPAILFIAAAFMAFKGLSSLAAGA